MKTKPIICPRCASKATEEHEIADTPWHWFFCRDCGLVWEDKPIKEREDGE